MIEVQGLTKRYGTVTAVDGISFSVRRGEVLGLLGPNAAGKTTTMRVVTCFLPADGGKVTVAGHDTAAEPLEVRRRIGYLPENNPLWPDMTAGEYLSFAGGVRGIPRRLLRARVDAMAGACGIGPVLGRTIGTLSKGYRQRVGLAATLVHDPEVLVLDEPTTGLDPNQIAGIRDLIREIGREKTVILSSHILPEVEATCERIVIISEGRIAGSGTPQELARQARGEEALSLLVRGPEARVRELLPGVPGVAAFTLVGPEDGALRATLAAEPGCDPREELFHLAVAEGWVLLELRRESASLEDVFRRLTSAEASGA